MEGQTPATVYYWPEAHDGPGFYYVEDEYPDEGSCGAFATLSEAIEHARENEHAVSVDESAARQNAQPLPGFHLPTTTPRKPRARRSKRA